MARLTRRAFLRSLAAAVAVGLAPPVIAQTSPIAACFMSSNIPERYEFITVTDLGDLPSGRAWYLALDPAGLDDDFIANFYNSLIGIFPLLTKNYLPIIQRN